MTESATLAVVSIIGFVVFLFGLIFAFNVWMWNIIRPILSVSILDALPPIVILVGVNMFLIFGVLSIVWGD